MNIKSIDFVLLIPCYNNSDGLMASFKSIVYPAEKYEILIVDDGSSIPLNENKLMEILPGVKIQVIRLDVNKGIVNALNTGLKKLKSRSDVKYIARLDAGDLNDEHRFYKQVALLDTQKEIALLASWARFESTQSDKGYDYITQTVHDKIATEMHYKCSFIHPSVMFRMEVLDEIGFYPENFEHAEDYAFFWKILKSYKTAVIPEKLVYISFSEKNVSSKNYKKQLQSRAKVVKTFGDQLFHKLLGTAMLRLKQMIPATIITKLKQL